MNFERVKGFYKIGAKTFMAAMVGAITILVIILAFGGDVGSQRPMVAFVMIMFSVTVMLIVSGWSTWIGVREANKVK